jgi:cytoskeleton protein RodZ
MAVTASEKRRIGTRLRRARVQRGIELDQAAAGTRITPRYLEALERDAPPDAFPAPVYARAFLREYAQWLGLDPNPLVDSYVEDHPEQRSPLALPLPVQKIPGKWARWSLPAISIAVLLTLVVVSTRSKAPPRAQVPSVPSPAASAAPAIGAAQTSPQALQGEILLALRVVESPCWVRVTSDGRVIMQTTLRPGFADTFTAARRLDVWLGNAGAVRLILNGERISRSEKDGAIYRTSFIRDGKRVRTVPYRDS